MTTFRPCSRGFTFVELLLGLMVMGMVMAAVGALLLAVSSSWQAAESSQALVAGARQGTAQLLRMARTAKYVGLATADGQSAGSLTVYPAPGASLMLWQDDGDGVLKLGDVSLVQHNRTTQTLLIYQIPQTSFIAKLGCSTSDLSSSSSAETFKNLPWTTSRTLAKGVSEASFVMHPAANGQRPWLEFRLKFVSGGQDVVEYNAATLRAPS